MNTILIFEALAMINKLGLSKGSPRLRQLALNYGLLGVELENEVDKILFQKECPKNSLISKTFRN